MHLNHKDILNLEKYYRINFVNQISGLRSPFLIGTKNKDGVENLGIFNSVVHVGANPPGLGFVMRPLNADRNTYDNIKSSGVFTLNLVHQDIIADAHHTSAKYAPEISEFDYTELTATYVDDFFAPFVEESKVKLGLSFVEEHKVSFNKTTFIVGKIEHVMIDDSYVEEDGHIMHELLKTSAVSGLDMYYGCRQISREDFARPKLDENAQ